MIRSAAVAFRRWVKPAVAVGILTGFLLPAPAALAGTLRASEVARGHTAGQSLLAGRTPAVVVTGRAILAYHLSPRLPMRLTLELRPRYGEQLQRFVGDVQRPGSPRFHHFLTINLRWHDNANGSAGGWSATTSIVLS
jgi:hypothetical protein